MVDRPRRPLLNPVLRFTKDPKPEGVTGGGKWRVASRRRDLPGSASHLQHNSWTVGACISDAAFQ